MSWRQVERDRGIGNFAVILRWQDSQVTFVISIATSPDKSWWQSDWRFWQDEDVFLALLSCRLHVSTLALIHLCRYTDWGKVLVNVMVESMVEKGEEIKLKIHLGRDDNFSRYPKSCTAWQLGGRKGGQLASSPPRSLGWRGSSLTSKIRALLGHNPPSWLDKGSNRRSWCTSWDRE